MTIHEAFRLGSAHSLYTFCQRPELPDRYHFQGPFALCTDQVIKEKFRTLLMDARRSRVPVDDKDELTRNVTEMWSAQTTLASKKDIIRQAEQHYGEPFNSTIHNGGDDGVSGNWTWYPIVKIEAEMTENDSTPRRKLVVVRHVSHGGRHERGRFCRSPPADLSNHTIAQQSAAQSEEHLRAGRVQCTESGGLATRRCVHGQSEVDALESRWQRLNATTVIWGLYTVT